MEKLSSLSKRPRCRTVALNQDPLDLIPSSIIETRRLVKVKRYTSYGANKPFQIEETSYDSKNLEAGNKKTFALKRTNQTPTNSNIFHPHHLREKLVLRGQYDGFSCNLGKNYVFHPNSKVMIQYHHYTGELSIRLYKEQFRLRLNLAINYHHKPFLKKFYQNFIYTGQLFGTMPPVHILQSLHKQRHDEWQKEEQRKLLLMRSKRHLISAIDLHEESKSQTELLLRAPKILKFEKVIGSGSTNIKSDGVYCCVPDLAIDILPEIITPIEEETKTRDIANNKNNHLQRNQGNHNLVINGLTANSTSFYLNNQQLANVVNNNHTILPSNGQEIQQQQFERTTTRERHQHQQIQQEDQCKHSYRNDNTKIENIVDDVPASSGSNVLSMRTIDEKQKIDGIYMIPLNHNQNFYSQQQHQRLVTHQQQLSQLSTIDIPQSHQIRKTESIKENSNASQQIHFQPDHQIQEEKETSISSPLMNSAVNRDPEKSSPSLIQQHSPQHISAHPHIQQLPNKQYHRLLPQSSSMQQIVTLGSKSHSPPLSVTVVSSSSRDGSGPSSSLIMTRHNTSVDLEDNELSHEEDDDDNENELDEIEPKQQLNDGGSSSSASLQTSSVVGGSQTTIADFKKAKPTYNCLICPKSYRKRKSLLDHYKIHPGYCHDCGQPNGTSLEEIIHHNRTEHAKEFPFVCETCGESYSRRQQFHAHVEAHNKKEFKKEIIHHNRTEHAKEFPFVCETCGESYSRRQQFHAHVEAHNKKEFKTYACVECGQKFSHKKLHQQHLEDTGHKADGAICEVCGAEFPSKNALYQHIIRVHKKDNFFECHICHNRFTLKANLERHVQLHTEIKRTYVCDLCGSSYFTYPALKDHYSNAHTDASECKCTLCGKRFGSAKSLQRHLPSHSEERPHCCCYCDQTFKWKTHLVRHKQTVHGNEPSPKKIKRFSKLDEDLVPISDMPGPPPVKVAKRSNSGKLKLQQQSQQQQQQQTICTVSTPPPLSTTPGTSSQQDIFNAAAVSNNSSQSSTASTSQHSLSMSEPPQNSIYKQNFSTEKLTGQQPQQCSQTQTSSHHPQQQQRPTPPPQPQALHHRHPPSINSSCDTGLIARHNNFTNTTSQGSSEVQFHFEQNAGTTASSTNAGSYQQHQIINQYQQHHNQQQHISHQQQHLRSHTPQSPHQQQQQQHFSSPHHMSTSQQIHHHQQLLHHQHNLQQQHRQHNQQRSPHHNQTSAQLQQQHHQQSHSPQHSRLQSPQPQSHTQQSQHVTQQQQQQYQQCASLQQQQQHQQQPNDAWSSIGFSPTAPQTNAVVHSQQQNAQSTSVTGGEVNKDNNNKFYIVDSSEFLGLPLSVANGAGTTPTCSTTAGNTAPQQHSPSVISKQQEQSIGGELLSFQNMWPQNTPATQIAFGGLTQQQQQQQQSQPHQHVGSNQSASETSDPQNYNNIGSILTNLIENTSHQMEYNFDLLQPGVVAPNQQQPHHNPQQPQQQQHNAIGTSYGLQQTPAAGDLMRHPNIYGSTGASVYDPHHISHHSVLSDISEHHQKNSFQPYHSHPLQAQSNVTHPLHSLSSHSLSPTAHHPLVNTSHLLQPLPPTHSSIYERTGYAVLSGNSVDDTKTVLPPISDYMHHIHQQATHPHSQQTDLIYYPVKND